MKIPFSISRFSRLLLLFMALLFVVTTVFFLGKGQLNFFNATCIAVGCLIISNYCIGIKRDTIIITLLMLLGIICTIGLSKLYIDLTFDGQAYHQEMIIQMSNGWNPIYEEISATNNQSIWLNHYAKGYEVIGAIFYSILGKITIVKFLNLVFLGLSFLYPFNYFKTIKSKSTAFLLALVIALNPVTLSQLMTNLIDGFLYAVVVITLFSYLQSKNKKTYLFDFTLGIILLVNIKFTGLVYAVILYGVLFLYEMFVVKVKSKTLVKRTVVVVILMLPFLIMPYLKNFSEKGHPFYPLMGENNIDFVEDYVPDVLKEKGRLEKLLFTNFVSVGNRSDSFLKIPFSFSFNELQKMRNGAPRVGSLGVWWGGILLVSILFYVYAIFRERKRFTFSVYEVIIGVILFLLIVNKAGWWLRYTPFVWAIPLLLYLSVSRYKKMKNELKILGALALVNAGLTVMVSLGLRYSDSKKFISKLEDLKNTKEIIHVDFGAYLGNKALFLEYGIQFKERSSTGFKSSKPFNNVVVIDQKLELNNEE